MWKKAISLFLGGIFVLSGILKTVSLPDFELYVFSFGILSFDLVSLAARLLVSFEIILGIGFLSGRCWKLVRTVCLAVLGFFSAFLLWRLAAGDSASCHCFGEIVDMSPAVSLAKNLLMMFLLGLVWRQEDRPARPLAAVAVSVAVVVLIFVCSPPDAFIRGQRKPSDLDEELFNRQLTIAGPGEGRKIVFLYSTSCEFCRKCAGKMSVVIKRHGIPSEDFFAIFMSTAAEEEMKSLVENFFTQYGGGISLDYTLVQPLEFIPMTSGAMPIVAFVEDGRLVREFDSIFISEDEIIDFLEQMR